MGNVQSIEISHGGVAARTQYSDALQKQLALISAPPVIVLHCGGDKAVTTRKASYKELESTALRMFCKDPTDPLRFFGVIPGHGDEPVEIDPDAWPDIYKMFNALWMNGPDMTKVETPKQNGCKGLIWRYLKGGYRKKLYTALSLLQKAQHHIWVLLSAVPRARTPTVVADYVSSESSLTGADALTDLRTDSPVLLFLTALLS
ncbi:hypothetical protein EVG20_g1431 [Dentipellis fragilis]|uniref:Uncharacterized protein n=1 Tax=Dentipellis fragilis TaxID=205917 RepID=A0A4Y9Z9Y1_9AGAM|nr:hypothetical protein EVG20_g1431 [Dentipellis fragilis]